MQKVVKYLQIEQDIISAIKNGELKPGDKVDSESILKKKYNVSTITVRKAFADLINQGYLYGVQGAGTFVTKQKMIRGLTSISFSEELLQQGYTIDMHINSIEEIQNPDIAEKLGISEDAKIIRIERVRLANNEPVAYHISYVSVNLLTLAQAESMKRTRSFYKTLNEAHLYPAWVNENYSVKYITDSNIYTQMNVKQGYPAFFIRRTAYDNQDNILEYSETYFNSDWYSVTVNIKA